MILDTVYLGDLVEQDPGALTKSDEIDENVSPQRIPSAVMWELFYGLGMLVDDESKRRRLRGAYESLVQSRVVADLDQSTARRAGTLKGNHEFSDELRNLDGADSIVAAHGLALDEPVVTNDRDFLDVDGLDVVTY